MYNISLTISIFLVLGLLWCNFSSNQISWSCNNNFKFITCTRATVLVQLLLESSRLRNSIIIQLNLVIDTKVEYSVGTMLKCIIPSLPFPGEMAQGALGSKKPA